MYPCPAQRGNSENDKHPPWSSHFQVVRITEAAETNHFKQAEKLQVEREKPARKELCSFYCFN